MYGIIGHPLGHSWSPNYFTKKFRNIGINEVYQAFPLKSIEEFPTLLKKETQLRGLNVTIPYKHQIIPYLDELTEVAQRIQAVNCIQIKNGKLIGHNTDVIGFKKSLTNFLPKGFQFSALILGTGGAAHAVADVFRQLQIQFHFISRKKGNGQLTYDEVTKDLLQNHLLIINTTPIGMWPKIEESPNIPYSFLTSYHFLFDLIYNPEKTLFLKEGENKGAKIMNGLPMLIEQAEASWQIWNS